MAIEILMIESASMELQIKKVGHRRPPTTPAERLALSWKLKNEVRRIHPWPQPRRFVFKAKTWEDSASWRAAQENPRLW